MPCRLGVLAKCLQRFGIELTERGGRHPYKLTRDGYSTFPIPAHGGRKTEIGDRYIDAACRHFGLDRDEVWKLIRVGKE